MSLLAELRRRNVIRMAGLYLVGAWLITQVAGTVLPMFGAPVWVPRTIVIVLAIGFIPALAFAWIFELTPDGIKRDEDVPLDKSIAPQTAQRMNRMIIAMLMLALVYFGCDKFVLAPKREARLDAATATAAAAAVSAHRATSEVPGVTPSAGKSIAVLPFENLSADKDNDYFASGMQDMILTKLAGISELKVISRTSTEKYKSHPGNLREIARQLGVTSILEGSVQKSGNQVLINVQLIDAGSDRHLWAEAYTRTLDNIFGVEGEVAQKIADALQAKLTTAEVAVVAAAPTRNAAAYDTFLKAEYLLQEAELTWVDATYLKADAGFRKAIALDPGFALAHAKLAYSQLSRNWEATPLSAAELAAVRPVVDRALALDPNLPEAHLALGYYHYWLFRHYDQAIVEFERTLQLAPSNAEALIGLSYVARRQGRLDESQSYMRRALAISPRDAVALGNYGVTFVLLREYSQAEQQLKTALALAPDGATSSETLLTSRLFGFGDVAGARAIYARPPAWSIPSHNIVAGDIFNLINARAYADFYDRKFDVALNIWDSAPTDTPEERRTGAVARVLIPLLAGRGETVRQQCVRLAPALRAELSAKPDSLSLLQQLSWIDVCLGRNAQAIAGAKRAAQLMSLSRDRFSGTFQLVGLAQVAAWAGDPDQSLQAIGQLLAMPAGQVMSIERLQGDPVWDPLRSDPRFIALLRAPAAQGETAP